MKLFKMRFPVKECDKCCHWAELGHDHCLFHSALNNYFRKK